MSDENATTIDLDDPEFQETTDYDPTQDINARTVPPELDLDGNVIDYDIKLSIGDNKAGKKEPYAMITKKGTKYVALQVKAQIQAPGELVHNSFVNFPFGSVSTMPFNGTNSMADLCRILGKHMPPKLSQMDQAAYVVSLLSDSPVVKGRIYWDAYCSNCSETVGQLVGERNWPEKKNSDGKVVGHISSIDCPKCKQEINASAKVKKFLVKS